jgi:hypothetical protein
MSIAQYWDKNKRVNNGINPFLDRFYWLKMLPMVAKFTTLQTGNSSPGKGLRQAEGKFAGALISTCFFRPAAHQVFPNHRRRRDLWWHSGVVTGLTNQLSFIVPIFSPLWPAYF